MKQHTYVRDMTKGSPLRHIISFAIPLLIGNLFQQLYNMADTVVVGHKLGDQAIAAIGAVVSLYSLIINIACDLNNGYGIVVTQKFGAHKPMEMRQAVAGMIMLNTAIGFVLTLLSLVFLRPLLGFMNTPPEIFEQSYAYIFAICAGIPVTVAYNMFAAILRALGNSRWPLLFLILASIVNIALDILFVWWLEAGGQVRRLQRLLLSLWRRSAAEFLFGGTIVCICQKPRISVCPAEFWRNCSPWVLPWLLLPAWWSWVPSFSSALPICWAKR